MSTGLHTPLPGTCMSILAAVGPQLPCELSRTLLGSRDWMSSATEQAGCC